MDRITSTLTKETFFAALEKLPKEKVEELLYFTEFLLKRERIKKSKLTLNPERDPRTEHQY